MAFIRCLLERYSNAIYIAVNSEVKIEENTNHTEGECSSTLDGRKEKAKTQREDKLERRSDTKVPRGREARHTWRRCAPEGGRLVGWLVEI
ncbi:hypothetical protein AVEN_86925-1 [Araneus ventricosus]|uniref:Uncharacterized protein n=1 Tax=Araneus ventricosus TaxID=182803 RepID=A0A4Y2QUE3_ARAVE|nr:hypothetical protein AVEN_86925-1 [Araneus ventricosus]